MSQFLQKLALDFPYNAGINVKIERWGVGVVLRAKVRHLNFLEIFWSNSDPWDWKIVQI